MKKEICVSPTMEAMEEVKSMTEAMMEEAMVPVKIALKMDVVVDEIFSNIINYSGAGRVLVRCAIKDRKIELDFTDDGVPYNPLEAKIPDITCDIDERDAGGLGIFLTRKLMDEMRYTYADGRNQLSLAKEF